MADDVDVPGMLQKFDMTREELMARLLWAIDGYRFDYITRAEMINRINYLIDNHPEAV